MEELTEILGRIGIEREREGKVIAEGFEAREGMRKVEFEGLLKRAEKIEEEEVLRLNRIKQDEAMKKAEVIKLETIRKMQEEEESRRLKEKIERELKAKLKQQKVEDDDQKELRVVRDKYEAWVHTMQEIKNKVLPVVSADEKWSKMCRKAGKFLGTKVGQSTRSSQTIERLVRLFFFFSM